MTTNDHYRIIGEAVESLKGLRWEKTQLREKARIWGLELEKAGQALQSNPESLAFGDEADAPANPQFTARMDRSVFDANGLAALLQSIRTNEDHIKQKEKIVNPI